MATRWAICGTGNIANDFCTTLKAQSEAEHKIVAVASRSAEKAAAFAKKFGIPKSVGSYAELAKLDNVDIVYVCPLSTLHVELCLLYINAGKNVLCETPMALSLEGCRKILAAARKKGVFFLEGVWSLFNPVYQEVKNVIDSGDIGEVRMVQTNFAFPAIHLDVPRLHDVSMGAGILMEMGSYLVQLANTIFRDNKPERVVSDVWKNKHGADGAGVITLRYSGGRYAVLSYNEYTPAEENFLVVRGTKGTIKVPDYFWSPTVVILPDGTRKEYPLPDAPKGFAYVYPVNCALFKYEQNAVRDALKKGLKESPLQRFEDLEANFEILQQVLDQNNIKY